MKLQYKILALCPLLFITQCTTISTGDGPSATQRDIYGLAQEKRDITFSVDFCDDYGPEAWFDKEEIIVAVREDFEESGLFNKVHYSATGFASARHYHFRVNLSGTDVQTRLLLANLSGLTLLTIPVWHNTQLDWSMSHIYKGKEVFATSSAQAASDVWWLPAIVAMPFFNHATTGSRMKHSAIYYFLKEIRANRLNELK